MKKPPPRPCRFFSDFRSAGALALCLLCGATLLFASDPLPRATPESAFIDPVRLQAAFDRAAQLDYLWSLVVVRHGHLVAEGHWRGGPTARHDGRSVTKSVTSTLIGIAIERGFLPGLDALMVDYLPPGYQPDDPAADAITVRHLLTMTSGFEWSENDEIVDWIYHPRPAAYILARPVVTTPGRNFRYNTAASHLLSLVLTEATGMSTLDFADEYLFRPLGITTRFWLRDPQGYYFGGHGVGLRTEDMAKLGVMFLRRGRFDGAQVVSPDWVAEASRVRVPLGGSFGPLRDIHYGYLWWLDRSLMHDAFTAWGWGGQFVFCVPALGLVVAAHSNWEVNVTVANRQEEAILDIIVDRILPAVQSANPPPRRSRGRASKINP